MTIPTKRFDNDDDATQYWQTLLRDGDADQKITARQQLATIFERRGMHAEALELLETNARAGVSDPSLYTGMALNYRSLGRPDDAATAMAHAAMLMSRQQAPPPQPVYQQPSGQYPPQQPMPAPAPAPVQNVTINNVVTVGGGHPPLIIRLIYFLLIGWWFGFIWIGAALCTFPLIITIPMGIWMLNRTSRAFFL